MLKNGEDINKERIVGIYNHAHNHLKNIQEIISKNEYYAVRENIERKALPVPKLQIKDHKKKNSKGEYSTRLPLPADNFTAIFPKLGYLGIKRIFDRNRINYSRDTIIQASEMKERFEKTCSNLNKDACTIFSFDAEAMYPSIKFDLIKKAVEFFSRNVTVSEEKTINKCLEMIKFEMCSNIGIRWKILRIRW